MISLHTYLQDINEDLLCEAFKSSKLREIASILKQIHKDTYNSGSYIRSKDESLAIMPEGVAWDKITDGEVFVGESGDTAFMKKYINDDYICIWYPAGEQYRDDRSYVNDNNKITLRSCFMTCGYNFIYNKNGSHANVYKSGTNSFYKMRDMSTSQPDKVLSNLSIISPITARENTTNHEYITRDYATYSNPQRKVYEFQVKDLVKGNILAYCVAVKKDTIVKYSTISLILSRLESQIGVEYANDETWRNQYAVIKRSKMRRGLEELKAKKNAQALANDKDSILDCLNYVINRLKNAMTTLTLNAYKDAITMAASSRSIIDFTNMFFGRDLDINMIKNMNPDFKNQIDVINHKLMDMDSYIRRINDGDPSRINMQQVVDKIKSTNEYLDSLNINV